MISALLVTAVLSQSGEEAGFQPWTFSAPGSNKEEFLVQIPQKPRATPKISPKNNWSFSWIVPGMGRSPGQPDVYSLRFRVYLQTRNEQRDLGPLVARAMLQLWGFNVRKLRLDHSPSYFMRLVDVYLCDNGVPGGEQRFGEDPSIVDEFGRTQRTNQIYIYDLDSFTQPIEMMREVAHEYGHATLPPVGGYKTPEYWANGFLGENLYLTWLNRESSVGRLKVIDTMGASAADLKKYVATKISPKIVAAALAGPDAALLGRKDKAGMDHFIGLALYAESLLPDSNFRRSLMLTGQSALEYANSVVEAASESPSLSFSIPASLRGKKIWLPVGKGKLTGARPLKSKNGWALVVAPNAPVRLTSPQN